MMSMVLTVATCLPWTITAPPPVLPVQMRISLQVVFDRLDASECVRSHMERVLSPLILSDGWFEFEGAILNEALETAPCTKTSMRLAEGFQVFGNRNVAVMVLRDKGRWMEPVVERRILWENVTYENPYSESIEKTIDWWRAYLAREGCECRTTLCPPLSCDREFHRSFLSHMKEVLEILVMLEEDPHVISLYTRFYPFLLLDEIYQETIVQYPTEVLTEMIRFPARFSMLIYRDRVEVSGLGRKSETL